MTEERRRWIDLLENKGACYEGIDWVAGASGSPERLFNTCPNGLHRMWLAQTIGVPKVKIVAALCACLELGRKFVPPGDSVFSKGIAVLRRCARHSVSRARVNRVSALVIERIIAAPVASEVELVYAALADVLQDTCVHGELSLIDTDACLVDLSDLLGEKGDRILAKEIRKHIAWSDVQRAAKSQLPK